MKLIFSEEALEAAASPDALDHPSQILRARFWVILLGILLVILVGLLWSVFGRIPIYVTGFGVLVNSGSMKVIQSKASGLVDKIMVKPGDHILENDILVILQQSRLERDLLQAREDDAEIQRVNSQMIKANEKQLALQSTSIARQKALLNERIELSAKVYRSQEKRHAMLLKFSNDDPANSESLLLSETTLMESKTVLASYELKIQELDLILEQATQKNIQTRFDLTHQMQTSRRSVEKMELHLEQNKYIRSQTHGTVLQLMVASGNTVEYGTRVLSVSTDKKTQALKNISYFAVTDGKQIKPGFRLLITPSTVKRERYGSIIGTVTSVSLFPVSKENAMNMLGSSELSSLLISQGAMIEVETALHPALHPESMSGYKWTSKDPPVSVTQGTMTISRVKVNSRAPITFLLPLLQSWFMGHKDDLSPPI